MTEYTSEKVRTGRVIKEISQEHFQAFARYGPHASLHEAYAIILEEVDELWEAVRMKSRGDQKERLRLARGEAIQIAAMCLKLVTGIDRELEGVRGWR